MSRAHPPSGQCWWLSAALGCHTHGSSHPRLPMSLEFRQFAAPHQGDPTVLVAPPRCRSAGVHGNCRWCVLPAARCPFPYARWGPLQPLQRWNYHHLPCLQPQGSQLRAPHKLPPSPDPVTRRSLIVTCAASAGLGPINATTLNLTSDDELKLIVIGAIAAPAAVSSAALAPFITLGLGRSAPRRR